MLLQVEAADPPRPALAAIPNTPQQLRYLFVGVRRVFILHGLVSRQPVAPAHLERYQVLHDGFQGLLFICDAQEL